MTKLVCLKPADLKVKGKNTLQRGGVFSAQAGCHLLTRARSSSAKRDAFELNKLWGIEEEIAFLQAILTFWIPSSFTHTFEKICLNILLRAKAQNRMAPRRSLWFISSRMPQASSRRTSADWRDSLESYKKRESRDKFLEKKKVKILFAQISRTSSKWTNVII